jgi:hypothetical protein
MQKPDHSGSPRADLIHGFAMGSLHIQDCFVWAEIYYLDSPTDYREYVPQSHVQLRTTSSDLVMLDGSNQSPAANGTRLPLLIVGVIFLLISAYFLHVIAAAF